MNYSALIQNRKSVRAFTHKKVPLHTMATLREYHNGSAMRLIPGLKTELRIFGAPQYLVLLSEKDPLAHVNAGFIMEALVLKLTELGLDSFWIPFTALASRYAGNIRRQFDFHAVPDLPEGHSAVASCVL